MDDDQISHPNCSSNAHVQAAVYRCVLLYKRQIQQSADDVSFELPDIPCKDLIVVFDDHIYKIFKVK